MIVNEDNYDEAVRRWRENVRKAEAELDALEELQRKFLSIHGYEMCKCSFYKELLKRIAETRRRMFAPQPAIDEEFTARW